MVYGSRFLGRIDGMEPINRWANEISNRTFSFLYGVKLTDINTCYKVFTRRAWEGMVITSRNFAFETEFTVKLVSRGYTIKEVAIDYTARSPRPVKKSNGLPPWKCSGRSLNTVAFFGRIFCYHQRSSTNNNKITPSLKPKT